MAMLPMIPQPENNWLETQAGLSLRSFPPNLAATLPEDTQKKILRYMLDSYIWPQIQERKPFEGMWNKMLDMYRIKLDQNDLSIEEDSPVGKAQKANVSGNEDEIRVADSVVFDAVERLTNLTHFVSMKEGIPIQYNVPKYFDLSKEDSFYAPMKAKLKSANAFLAWNFENEEVVRKHSIAARELYKYGIVFASSEFDFKVQQAVRYGNDGAPQIVPEIIAIGTTFDPISVRRLFLNYRLSAHEMDYQPCPFFYDVMPRFATLQNVYHPQQNPFGFVNLDKVAAAGNTSWLFSDTETESFRKAVEGMLKLSNQKDGATLAEMLKPAYSVEQVGTLYPMLPLDPVTGEFLTRADGQTPVPMSRFIVNTFGTNVYGQQVMLRIQRNFFPRDMLPLYGTAHMPDLDSGLYAPSIGYLLWNHYREICTCKAQFIENKDWINNPPAWVLASSPAYEQDLTKKGNKVTVNGPNDFGWRTPFDATASTVAMMQHLREQAQTAAKSGDAILGKALGGRTSATEASNAFQASMSAVTSPINLFNYDIMGGFANRVWEYTATWFPAPLLEAITGNMGFAIKPEDLWLRVGLKWDVGSSYVESIVRQQNIRYMLETSIGDPTLNRAKMWRALLEEWRFPNASEWVNDGGVEREISIATEQAIRTFQGEHVIINPDQDHQIAMRVKTRFLEDQNSVWMSDPNYRKNAPALVQQVQLHNQFLLLQQQQMLLQMKLRGGSIDGQTPPPELPAPPAQDGQISAGIAAQNVAHIVQQGGGRVA